MAQAAAALASQRQLESTDEELSGGISAFACKTCRTHFDYSERVFCNECSREYCGPCFEEHLENSAMCMMWEGGID